MGIYLSALEHSRVPIQVREILSFTKAVTGMLDERIGELPDVHGCVLLSTCNRTELYISADKRLEPGRLLCQAAQVDYAPFAAAFETCEGQAAVRHLTEVSSGLRSRIWGEDQIIAQVKGAIALARSVRAADPVLETLFRTAVAAGKEVRSRVRLTEVPTSAAARAVALLEEKSGSLCGRSAMVIGNGEMGRLAAKLLHEKGCEVTVTLRTYRHGETLVPAGCRAVPYEARFAHMDGTDLLISATTSPHYTVSVQDVAALAHPPAWMVDLSIPRDLQPEIATQCGVTMFNVDDLQDDVAQRQTPPLALEILDRHEKEFYRWLNYKDCMPAMEQLKQAVTQRVLAHEALDDCDTMELTELVVGRTVDLLAGGLSDLFTPERLEACGQKIRAHTTVRPGQWD